uniref:Retrotransposon gag domain-containing protein n=1 Tax=Anopheles culicifacies TaxID=139723 RepID=A0A182LRF1_9DIPT
MTQSKEEMLRELEAEGIDVPESAMITQIRQLHASVAGSIPIVAISALEMPNRISDAEEPRGADILCDANNRDAAAYASAILSDPSDAQFDDNSAAHASAICPVRKPPDVPHADGANPSAAFEAIDVSVPAYREDDLSTQIKVLHQQLQLAELRQKINALELKQPAPPKLKDFENLIEPLNGDKDRDVIQWFSDLEHVIDLYRVRETDNFLLMRRLLIGSAAVVAKTSKVTTYEGLKQELIKNLHVKPTIETVYRQLRNRRLLPKESANCYMLEMQRIASQAVIPESELIDIIIDGLGSPSQTACMKYIVSTINYLKQQLKRFELSRKHDVVKTATTRSGSQQSSSGFGSEIEARKPTLFQLLRVRTQPERLFPPETSTRRMLPLLQGWT